MLLNVNVREIKSAVVVIRMLLLSKEYSFASLWVNPFRKDGHQGLKVEHNRKSIHGAGVAMMANTKELQLL